MTGLRLFRMSLLVLAAMWSIPAGSFAQNGDMTDLNQSPNPLLRAFAWRSIGPVGQGGRVDDIAVDPTNPFRYYVGFATGGLWRTTNNGTTFEPIFDAASAEASDRGRSRASTPDAFRERGRVHDVPAGARGQLVELRRPLR